MKSEILRGIENYFCNLPGNRIDQSVGNYVDGSDSYDCGCCVFAHVCHYFDEEIPCPGDFKMGANLLAKKLSLPAVFYYGSTSPYDDVCSLTELLEENGASDDPYSDDEWPSHPAKVFGNMAKHYEELGE